MTNESQTSTLEVRPYDEDGEVGIEIIRAVHTRGNPSKVETVGIPMDDLPTLIDKISTVVPDKSLPNRGDLEAIDHLVCTHLSPAHLAESTGLSLSEVKTSLRRLKLVTLIATFDLKSP